MSMIRASAVLAVATLVAACTPPLPDEPAADPASDASSEASDDPSTSGSDDPSTAASGDETTASEQASASAATRTTIDLREGWPRLDPVTTASGDDTSTVRIRGLDPADEASIVWILWHRPSTDTEDVFRVTQTGLDQLRHLTRGAVAGISQQVLAPGADAIELLVVSSTPWELTAFRGGRAQLPDVAREDVTGSGPTWLAVGGEVELELDLERTEQVTLLQLYDSSGSIVRDVGLTPEQLDEPIEVGPDVTVMLLDVDGPWTLAAAS